jgi:hypothetical protein
MSLQLEKQFALFELQYFPFVIVKLNKLNDISECVSFLKQWEQLYAYEKYFTIIIDARKVKNTNFRFGILISKFIKKLRKKNPQYLESSILIYNNRFVKHMFSFILSFEKPISPTYLYYTIEKGLVNYIELYKNKDKEKKMKIYN